MLAIRVLTSICAVVSVCGVALAQGTAPPAAGKAPSAASAKTEKAPATKSSKASADPTKTDLGKQEQDKQKKAAKAACEDKCAQDFPVTSKKTTAPAKDPCAGLSNVAGAYTKCVAEKTSKHSPESTSAAGSVLTATLNKPKYEACMKKCGRGQ